MTMTKTVVHQLLMWLTKLLNFVFVRLAAGKEKQKKISKKARKENIISLLKRKENNIVYAVIITMRMYVK